jgi:hypothetical protein
VPEFVGIVSHVSGDLTLAGSQDPAGRARAESRKPIAVVTGSLVSTELSADTDIRPRLSENLSVGDERMKPVLRRPARYGARPGEWPEVNSKEYNTIIDANLPWLPPGTFEGR